MSDLFERLAQRPRGGEPERLGDILPRVLAAIVRHVEDTRRARGGEPPVTRVPLPSTTRRAEALIKVLLDDGLDLQEIADVCAEAFRIAGERRP